MSYLPIPPRAWSRVQSQCTYVNPDSSYNSIYIPLINKTVSPGEALYYDKLQYKGNILQYKNNSIGLSKRQKYAQIAKGLGPSRTKVFATQTQTYTNANTSSLYRVGFTTYSSGTASPQAILNESDADAGKQVFNWASATAGASMNAVLSATEMSYITGRKGASAPTGGSISGQILYYVTDPYVGQQNV